MGLEQEALQNLELQHAEVEVVFDLDTLTLVGRYNDEISAQRAKRSWKKTLQDCFLLDSDTDIKLKTSYLDKHAQFALVCEFNSSCARYAFWRLTNNHVPEAAYLLEIAHLPESKNQQYISGPDLRSVVEHEMIKLESGVREQKNIFKKIGEITKTFVKSL